MKLIMTALIQSFSMVAIAEIGDKTQLLSILLAARFRVFWPIIAGVFIATIINHGLVAWLGSYTSELVNAHWLSLVVSLLFIAVGLWTLLPDTAPEDSHIRNENAFIASCIAFFIAEMGDKTQLATLTLGAQYSETTMVIIGTTLGMLAANIPAILFGENLLKKIPLRTIRITACIIFLAFGITGLTSWYFGKG